MIACIVHGPGAPKHVVERAERVLAERGAEVWRAERDAPASSRSGKLQKTDLILTLGGDGTFLAGGRLAAPRRSFSSRSTSIRLRRAMWRASHVRATIQPGCS